MRKLSREAMELVQGHTPASTAEPELEPGHLTESMLTSPLCFSTRLCPSCDSGRLGWGTLCSCRPAQCGVAHFIVCAQLDCKQLRAGPCLSKLTLPCTVPGRRCPQLPGQQTLKQVRPIVAISHQKQRLRETDRIEATPSVTAQTHVFLSPDCC